MRSDIRLLYPLIFILMLSASACKVSNNADGLLVDSTQASVTPEASISITSTPAPVVIPEITAPTLTPVPVQYEQLSHTVRSSNGKYSATAYTKRERYNGYRDSNEIIEKVVIEKGDTSLEINTLAAYYGNMSWSPNDTKLVVSYYGRLWSDFSIFNAVDAALVCPEINFNTIRTFFENNGVIFEYKENENRPDPQIIFEEWSKDSRSIKVKYSIIDTDWQTQSGSFWYEPDSGEMKDLEQYPPYDAG